MRHSLIMVPLAAALLCLTGCICPPHTPKKQSSLELGAFSVSLAVEDLATSRAFYEKLGFKNIGGSPEENYVVLKNGNSTIGLFQGMFEGMILTFNPGWNSSAKPLKHFTDVRQLQRKLKDEGLTFISEADPATTGPASFMLADPDGNVILVDQHVK